MPLPTPNYPGTAYTPTAQDTGSDPASPDAAVAEAQEYNELLAETKAMHDDMRAAAAAVPGPTSSTDVAEAMGVLRASWGLMIRTSAAFSVTTSKAKLTGTWTSGGVVKGAGYVTFDTDKLVIGANGGGTYRVSITVSWFAPANDWDLSVELYINGSPSFRIMSQTGETSGIRYRGHMSSIVTAIADGDELEVYVAGESNQSVTFDQVEVTLERIEGA